MKLRIIRGIPGSGKSTFAKSFGCLHVENDMFRMRDGKYHFDCRSSTVKNQCKRFVEEALRLGVDVCVSNVFYLYKTVDEFVELGKHYGADVEVYKMVGHFENVHGVPDHAITHFENEWEDYRGEKIIKT